MAGRPEPVYRFRHALIQEATYNGLLRAERRLLHGRAAWALEAASQGRVAEVAAVLGRHFAAAGEAARALRYFEMAAAVAVSRQIPQYVPWLPGDLESALEEACQAWDRGQPGLAGERLAAAVALARHLNYC